MAAQEDESRQAAESPRGSSDVGSIQRHSKFEHYCNIRLLIISLGVPIDSQAEAI